MYRVLVVDDEPKVRRGLTALIPRLDAEWTVVGAASNGAEALDMVKMCMPDLVITDIRMPQMNGLDLLSALKEYPVHVVILSGYGYFEYAQTAVKFGAFEYLLKPFKPDEIQGLLSRVKAQRPVKQASTGGELSGAVDVFKWWRGWLTGVDDEPQDVERLRALLPTNGTSFQIILLEIDHFDDLITEDQWGDRHLVLFAVRNIVQELISGDDGLFGKILYAHGSQLVYLVANAVQTAELSRRILDEVRRWVKISVSVGISELSQDMMHLPKLHNQALEALQNKWIYGGSTVSDYSDIRLDDVAQSGYPTRTDEELIQAIRAGQQVRALELLETFVEALKREQLSFRLFRRFCLQLAAAVVRVTYELRIHDLVFKQLARPFDVFDRHFQGEEFVAFMRDVIVSCVEALVWSKEEKQNRSIERAIAYLQANYTRDLPLEEVAVHVRMNASYFCTLFKQETGQTFTEYVTRARMDKAKSLMVDPALRLYEISQMVGYQDVKYFSRLFKKVIGVTPAEYRQFFFRKEE